MAARVIGWQALVLTAFLILPLEGLTQPPAAPAAAVDPLPLRALQRFGTSHWRHGSRIQCLAFAPDGSRIAAGGGNDPIRIWDAVTGKQLQQLADPWVNALAFSRRGTSLYTGGALKIVHIWSVDKVKEVAQLTGHAAAITALAVSTDNTLLASGSHDGTVILWEIETRSMVAQFKGHTDAVTSLSFSTDLDSVYLASGSADRTVRVWHVDKKTMHRQLDAGCSVAAVAFTDDKTVAAAGDDKVIRLWNVVDGQVLPALQVPGSGIVGLAAGRDGKTLVSSGEDGTLRVWDLAGRKELRAIARHVGDGDALALSRDGQVACGGANHTIRVFDVTTGQERLPGLGLQAGLAQLALAPDGRSIASVSSTGTVTIWDRAAGKVIRAWETGHTGEIVLGYAPAGSIVATGSRADPIRCWDASTGKEAFQLPAKPGDQVQALAFAPRGTLLALGYRSGNVDVWDWRQQKIVQQPKLATQGGVLAVAFSPEGDVIALGGSGKVALWDIAAGKEIRLLDTREGVNAASQPAVASLAFAADNKTLAVGCYDGTIRLVDRIKGKEIRALEGHGSVPFALSFSPDGRVLASGSFDKTVRLWEAFSGLTIASLAGHQGPVNGVAMTADGRGVFSASSDTSMIYWDVTGRGADGFEPGKSATVDFEAAWRDLASEDSSRGHRALWELVVQSPTAVPFLGKQIYLIDPTRIDQLFKDLGDKSFAVRKNASAELERYGRWMEGRFKEALVNPPELEVQRRIEQMLAKLTGGLTIEQERMRVRRAMLVLEQVNSEAARQILKNIVQGAPEVELQNEAKVSLERLAKRQ